MGGEVTQLSWRKCQKVVLANGPAKSGASLGQVAVSLANRRALVWPAISLLWRSVGYEGPGLPGSRTALGPVPAHAFFSQAKEAAGERLPRCRRQRAGVLAWGRGAEWPVTGCAGSWRCCRAGEMGGRRPGCAEPARRSWA